MSAVIYYNRTSHHHQSDPFLHLQLLYLHKDLNLDMGLDSSELGKW